MTLPPVPAGSGRHPILVVAISAPDLPASTAFYSRVFGWALNPVAEDRIGAIAPGGPAIVFRGGLPAGSPGAVPFIDVPDAGAGLERVVAAAGQVDRAPWVVPGVGTLAQFRDPSGTTWGLIAPATPVVPAPIPAPFGGNPHPAPNTICSIEMHSATEETAARFFGGLFGWGTLPTMPQYLMFDPGAGIGGVFQTHTPAAPAMPYVWVADVAATLTAVEAAGGARQGEPASMPGMATFGYFLDPSGTGMGLMGPA